MKRKMIKVASSQATNNNHDLDGRFAYLLNPIRDLAKNWEIDIAAYLEEYLAELEGITITFNDGATTLNFAQAALLIQGTTCVYSKKVEYLYNLVFQMLDLLSTKRQIQQQKNTDEAERRNSTLPSMEENHLREEHRSFTYTLDLSNSDMQKFLEYLFLSLDDIKEHNNLEMNENLNTLNKRKSSIQLLPCMPTSLIPLDEGEKGNVILYSKKGEVLGNKNDYRLNICSVHHSGALLLHMCNNIELFEVAPPSTRESEVETENRRADNIPSENEDCCDDLSPSSSPLPVDTNDEDNAQQENSKMLPIPTPSDMANKIPTPTRRSARLQKKLLPNPVAVKIDPWKTEEPHEEKQQCKASKGKSIKLPKKLQQKKSQTRKKAKKPLPLSPIAKFCAKAYFSHTPKFSKNQFKIPEMVEVEYIYWAEMKSREKFWKSEQKRKQLEERIDENYEEEDQNFDDDGNCSDLCDDDNAVPDDVPCMSDGENDEQQNNLLESNSRSEEMPVVSSYEKLVQKYVESYLSSAAQYCQMTELTRRVNEWEDKITPKLQEEEGHELFDIHVYGSRVLDCFGNNNRKQTIGFATLCQGKKPWEICRYFLATLQLANTYNLQIESDGQMDSVELTLLSRKRHHEDLKEFDPS